VPRVLLADRPGSIGTRYRDLRLVHLGSAPVPEPLLRRAIEVFQCDVVVGYGMTEASAGTSVMTPADTARALTTPRICWPASGGR
jgi:acyl-CoA synthetase (AMP-forming)/AMP-acid ligase II